MSQHNHPYQPANPEATAPSQDILEERRAALAKLGLLAGYVAPATLTLLVTPRRSAASESVPPTPSWG